MLPGRNYRAGDFSGAVHDLEPLLDADDLDQTSKAQARSWPPARCICAEKNIFGRYESRSPSRTSIESWN